MSKHISEEDILELIPQRPPFIMIDRLICFNPIVTTSELEIKEDNIFFFENSLSSAGLVENIAQTCAARIGYINKLQQESVKLGFIGAIRNLHVYRTPKKGEIITTTITVKEEIFKMTLVDAVIKVGKETIVSTEMKIALSDIDSKN